jgi:hypothetical protein
LRSRGAVGAPGVGTRAGWERWGRVAGAGDEDLLAVGELAGEVDGVEVGAGGDPAGGVDGVVDPAAGGEAEQAGVADVAGDVDGQAARGVGSRRGAGLGPRQGLARTHGGPRTGAARPPVAILAAGGVRQRGRPCRRSAAQVRRGPDPHEPGDQQRRQGEEGDRDPLPAGTGQQCADPGPGTLGQQERRRRLRHGAPSGWGGLPPEKLAASAARRFSLSTPPDRRAARGPAVPAGARPGRASGGGGARAGSRDPGYGAECKLVRNAAPGAWARAPIGPSPG